MIKLLRFVNGEDVISNVEKKGDVFVLKQPHRLILTKDGLGSMPLCPFAKNTEYEVAASNIMFEAEPEAEIRDSYAAQVGAIVIAKSEILKP